MARKAFKKATNLGIDAAYLKKRGDILRNAGYKKARWIEFGEAMLALGYEVELYEARETNSKYLTVAHRHLRYKVRFSNHKPIFAREVKRDCDFFVGVTHLGVTTTEDAIAAVKAHFCASADQLARIRGLA